MSNLASVTPLTPYDTACSHDCTAHGCPEADEECIPVADVNPLGLGVRIIHHDYGSIQFAAEDAPKVAVGNGAVKGWTD